MTPDSGAVSIMIDFFLRHQPHDPGVVAVYIGPEKKG